MKIEDLMKGTFLEEIFKIAKEGNFGEPRGALPLRKNEEAYCLCEATSLEKACRVCIDTKNREAERIIISGVAVEDERVQVLLRLAHDVGNILRALLQEHLGNKELEIRQGWKVVEITEDNVCSCIYCRLKRYGGKVVVIDMKKPESLEGDELGSPPTDTQH